MVRGSCPGPARCKFGQKGRLRGSSTRAICAYEHPTQALLDALTPIRRNKGRIEGLTAVICGDILHSRVARSPIYCCSFTLGARVRVVSPIDAAAAGIPNGGSRIFRDMRPGLIVADIVMTVSLQRERMQGGYFPSAMSIFAFSLALIMQSFVTPSRMRWRLPRTDQPRASKSICRRRRAEGASIREQVEMGVAVRIAVLEAPGLAFAQWLRELGAGKVPRPPPLPTGRSRSSPQRLIDPAKLIWTHGGSCR